MNGGGVFFVLSLALLSVAAGCGGGPGSMPGHAAGTAHPAASVVHQKSKLGLTDAPLGPCPPDAVFLRLAGEIRGYPRSAGGPTAPCTDIIGPYTLLSGNGLGYGAIAASVHGNLHALAFQSNGYGGLLVFPPQAGGNEGPYRSVLVDQDHVALAIDSNVNDFVVASQNYTADNCWYVVTTAAAVASASNCDAGVSAIFALATTPRDELVVLGSDAATQATRLDVFGGPASASPALLRSIVGPATGLPVSANYFADAYSLATDPVAGTIYVLSADANGLTPPKVSVFAADAAGDVAPVRTLSGPHTGLPHSIFAINVLAVDELSNLYVNSTGVTSPAILVSIFAPDAAGDATPVRSIVDDTALAPGSGGIAVRGQVSLPSDGGAAP